ncbi:ABC-2 type transport system permease protein [Geodermatophilus siccatus]|uniref:ABC-2 type transport system permease protein n=1 Tax=Geodermatophilus siccatus TaxID=1137991 RepID=A0A1G9QBW2_9ACTN|nr:hypothetical protein [Geodermatophilus siccatus]SDM08562.1 ABC-2 type transport system permease protein [Geodermatophilus siccatus]
MAAQAGFTRLGSVQRYVSGLKAVLAIPIGAFAAARIAALAAAIVLAAATGPDTWGGASWVGGGLGLGEALAGALSVVPTSLLRLSAARTPAPVGVRADLGGLGGQIGGQPSAGDRWRPLRTAQDVRNGP